MPFSAATAASWCRGTVQGDAARTFQTMEAFDRAEAAHLTFIGLPELAKKMSTCPAGGAICSRGLPVQARPDQVLIWVENADLAVAEVLDKLATELALPPVGVHPTAVVDPAANLGKDVRIGPLTVIEAGAQLGDRTVVMAQGFVGQNSVLGSDCFLWPTCTELSSLLPSPMIVSANLPRSTVALAPISQSLPMDTPPMWGILT